MGKQQVEKWRPEKKKPWSKWFMPGICLAGSVVLYAILAMSSGEKGPISAEGKISREGYGGDERQYQVLVEGLEEQEIPFTLTVGARTYTDEEADQVFIQIMDTMEDRIRGDNPSLMEVRTDLILPTRLDEEGVRLRWYSSDPELLDSHGNVREKAEQASQGQTVILSVELSDGVHQQNYELPVRVLPPERTPQEQQIAGFLKELEKQDQEQSVQPYLSLPESFEGKQLRYRTRQSSGYEGILLLGIAAAVLLTTREQSEQRQKDKKRERELLLDYADVLSKLMVLIGAGLTVRNAWERMVRDYEAGLEQKKLKPRAAYDEMRHTCYQMQSGMSEGEAYREFGRRCGLRPYLKLSSLLEQNRRAGTKNLRMIFQAEMADALEQRKNLARKLGEEAGTKLLLPLFMMLGIVMVMIMVPAMMTMG